MKEEYKPIPADTTKLILTRWGCGDECNCNYYKVSAELSEGHPLTPHWRAGRGTYSIKLWESSWFWWGDDIADREELMKEIEAACKHYEIKLIKDESIYDWEGERVLTQTDDKSSAEALSQSGRI